MEDLTNIVTTTLEARGVLGKIRAQLRANVFCAIHEQQPPQQGACAALEALRSEQAGHVAVQLIHDLLLSCELDYSTSVFLPECGLAAQQVPLWLEQELKTAPAHCCPASLELHTTVS